MVKGSTEAPAREMGASHPAPRFSPMTEGQHVMQLPIEAVLPTLHAAFAGSHTVVLSAPPGAGKTTRVPLALLEEGWLAEKKILMLEPRRLAARRSAEYMASVLRERIGETVGFRIRGESRVTPRTRIEVITEGILSRILQEDPALSGTGLVIFDEFHERSVHADLGLALTLDAQTHLRPDLRILVMSATLDDLSLSRILTNPSLVKAEGRSHSVETRYLPYRSERPVEARVAESIRRAVREEEGDILVFLPGQREIRRTELEILERPLFGDPVIRPLFGDAGYERQREALEPDPAGRRKVILSTSIAETSLTIDGVRIVIDAGLTRSTTFDPRRGMSGLVTTPVSRASADQRRGRAGRQGPGVCYRLWTKEEHESLPAFSTPEILAADLAPLALDLALWGTPRGEGLRFLDPPPPAHLSQARTLLRQLGALEKNEQLTDHGRAIAQLPAHPRLAHMMIRGKELGCGGIACDVAALLEDRDLLAGGRSPNVDLHARWTALHQGRGADPTIRGRVSSQSKRFRDQLDVEPGTAAQAERYLGILLAFAYPERVARQREKHSVRYQMASGTGAVLPAGSLLAREAFLAVGEVDGAGTEVRIFLAAPVRQDELVDAFSEAIAVEDEVAWDRRSQSVIARQVRRLGALILKEQPIGSRNNAIVECMLEGITEMGLASLPWNAQSESLRQRSEWLRKSGCAPPDWPDLSDQALMSALPRWMGPFLDGVTRREQLEHVDLTEALNFFFTRDQFRELDRLAPSHLRVPGGSMIRIDYSADPKPILAVRLQEMFGETDTPHIAGGKVPLVVHLLSPARRPLAVTQDLGSFWANVYPGLRKQMQARYPRHHWPEDPLEAAPTNKAKRRRNR
jgi:ATP-dependent RNA helicase HrpB